MGFKFPTKGLKFNRPEYDDMIGKRYSRLVVVEKTNRIGGHCNYYWRCQCDCGNFTEVLKSSLAKGKIRSCGCMSSERKTAHGEISGDYWYSIRSGAVTRNLKFDLDIKYVWELFLIQNRKCALSGVELAFGERQTASLDRINSKLGYIVGNVQWVHKKVNKIKWNLDYNELYYWCKKISDYKYEKEAEIYGNELLYC